MRRPPEFAIPASLGAALAAYWSTLSLLIHRSFHSNGWDLGLITQVIWNTAHGYWFSYSFRAISYRGDHWQPALFVLTPLMWFGSGVENLLIAQGVLLGVAVIPLYYAVRQSSRPATAVLVCLAYALSLGVSQAVSFDWHFEAAVPLLAFTALFGLTSRRTWLFVLPCLALLTIREDSALIIFALLVTGAAYYGLRRSVLALGAVTVAYGAWVNLWLIPHYRGDDLNPLRERYHYLGDSVPEILLGIPMHPLQVADHVFTADAAAVAAILLLLSGGAFILRPWTLLAVAPMVFLPLLSDDPGQSSFDYHYLLVPSTFAVCALVVLLDRFPSSWPVDRRAFTCGIATAAALIFAWQSPLPPSFSADLDRFRVDHHARVARSFVDMVPGDATVSAQSSFVPHLSERRHIFQFPRVLDAEYVLIDHRGSKTSGDIAAGFETCFAALPSLGFTRLRDEDGIELWQRPHFDAAPLGLPSSCDPGSVH